MASLADLPIRDNLRGLTPYGAPQEQVSVALNVNENTHPIPESVAHDVVTSLARALMGINRYPDREFTTLRERLASYVGHGATADHVWAANGSNEVLQQVLQAFGGPGRSVLGFPPTYSMHSIIAAGTDTTWVAGERDPGYELSPALVTKWIEKTKPDLVFLCAPNNPTGTPVSLDTIVAAYDATDGMVVVDEAYAEFAPEGSPSALSLLEGRERLIVSRTMSKAFAFAGARVGYMIADPAVCDAIRLVRLPYHLSALTQAAAVAALDHTSEMLGMVGDIRGQRDRLLKELSELGFTVWPSEANFVLFGGVHQPHALFEALLERDIIIRDLGIPHHLRVTAGTERETTLFLEALRDLGGASFGAR
ncbi:histidinol-phosphate transaminase [Salinibacterium sp. dk2585]|uniref:histidinol-phosphate transaminase n=1 Tax=unclassified Salinibacterium TaxID=2632331 RepID=UPI0011C250CC|nr:MULTISPECIES: histidinol-phosphate transaminase [unclassified Salinibacterium]QEE61647.1 histidinol-phosphate transaminase [Salinibacterium sp. dk2585]TXK54801.1 histidinol-phosphate transaminase [Salinibacterium sp. dk5596]